MNKRTIIILSVVAAMIIASGISLYFNLKSKGTSNTNSTIKVTNTNGDSSITIQGNYNTIPYNEKTVIDSGEQTTEQEHIKISATPNGETTNEEATPQSTTTPANSPEVTGVLDPLLEFKPFDVESSDNPNEPVRINITKPTYILFIDLTNEESVKMLTVVNNLSMSYSDVVDFVLISNLAGDRNEIKEYMTTHGINIPLFFDDDENNSPIKNYNIQSLPHTLIIDKFGNIVNSISGLKEADTIAANLDIISENFD